MAARRFYASQEVEHDRLQRADPPWILSRGGERFNPQLFAKHVVVIGVGSLGSGVARSLVKAGVGRLTLIDVDILRWENIARHELGGAQVGHAKAYALREDLLRNFPFACIDAHACSWQDAFRGHSDLFADVDLVISTTGDWPSDCQLNELLRDQRNVKMVFGWVEARAAAVHVLVVGPEGGCLACGMNAAGDFVERAIEWPESQLVRVPACGETYVPYGDAMAMRARAAIVEEILSALTGSEEHSTLFTEVNDELLYVSQEGRIRDAFVARLGRVPGAFGARLRSQWLRQERCAVCERGATSA
jgi:molybdopterin/thiamine biosynthesis adenylyltransferase